MLQIFRHHVYAKRNYKRSVYENFHMNQNSNQHLHAHQCIAQNTRLVPMDMSVFADFADTNVAIVRILFADTNVAIVKILFAKVTIF